MPFVTRCSRRLFRMHGKRLAAINERQKCLLRLKIITRGRTLTIKLRNRSRIYNSIIVRDYFSQCVIIRNTHQVEQWLGYLLSTERFTENRTFNNKLCCFRHATTVRQVSPRHGRGATRKAEHDTRLLPSAQVQHELVEVFIKTPCRCYCDD